MTRPTRIMPAFPILVGGLGGVVGSPDGSPPPVDCCADPANLPDRAASENGAYAVTWQTEYGTPTDQNAASGTDSDGGGTRAFVDPTNANDGSDTTHTDTGSYAGGASTSYLVADLGTAYYVETIVIRGEQSCGSDTTLGAWEIEASDNGSSWSSVATTKVWNGLGLANGLTTFTLVTPAVHRYWRLFFDDTATGGFHCGSVVYTFDIQGSTPVDFAWNVPAPLSIDGDDATYDQDITSADVLRVDLGAAYEIARVRLFIGTETSGSRTYTLSGANEPDFSDVVSDIFTMTFSATGSYTGQEVTASMVPDTAYRYWQLSGNDENRRIYSIELYEASLATNHQHSLGSASDVVAPSPVVGDLLVFDGTDWVTLPVGGDGQLLSADSGEATGLKWIDPWPSML